MTTAPDRLTTLEIRVAEHERTIDELSQQIVEQWKVVERIEHKLSTLTERFLTLEAQSAPDIPITKPPHW
jgi:SlyX protein